MTELLKYYINKYVILYYYFIRWHVMLKIFISTYRNIIESAAGFEKIIFSNHVFLFTNMERVISVIYTYVWFLLSQYLLLI